MAGGDVVTGARSQYDRLTVAVYKGITVAVTRVAKREVNLSRKDLIKLVNVSRRVLLKVITVFRNISNGVG